MIFNGVAKINHGTVIQNLIISSNFGVVFTFMFDPSILHPSLIFRAVRSSGKGGQHVNKVSTAVELYFDIKNTPSLSEEQKTLIGSKLKNRISEDGVLQLVCQTERSQHANKKKVTDRFDELIIQSLRKRPKRVATKMSKVQKEKRLELKRKRSEIKQLRKKEW